MKSGINPFDSQEAKPYKNDPEILAMTNLVSAYSRKFFVKTIEISWMTLSFANILKVKRLKHSKRTFEK